jgi:hypothetical protein
MGVDIFYGPAFCYGINSSEPKIHGGLATVVIY